MENRALHDQWVDADIRVAELELELESARRWTHHTLADIAAMVADGDLTALANYVDNALAAVPADAEAVRT